MTNDPMESLISTALDAAGVRYTDENHADNKGLDFFLPDFDIHIEVKRFHASRIAEQMERAENVIAVQGIAAARWMAELIRKGL